MHGGGSWSGTHARKPLSGASGRAVMAPLGVFMMKRAALAFSFVLLLGGYADAETPRKGGTIRMTAPYGTNISTMDMHTTPRAQDDIYGKVVHRTLYNYDSDKGVPVLELAKSVAVSSNG